MKDPISLRPSVRRLRHELRRRAVHVTRVEAVGPGFARLTLAGAELTGFASPSFDDHIKLIVAEDGQEIFKRDYTPRRFDPVTNKLTLEIGLHAHGIASDWARRATPGLAVTIGGPKGSTLIPVDYAWHVLGGDAAALPAIVRRLEELPATTRAIVILQVPEADRRALSSAAALQVHWVTTADAFIASFAALAFPAGDGFIWGAGEATTMSRLRDILLVEKGLSPDSIHLAAYWRQNATAYHENVVDPLQATSPTPPAAA